MTNVDERSEPPDDEDKPALPAAIETTERYEIEDGIVFYDATNPLAWLEASHALWLTEQV